jgi:hypothetical protein
MNDNRKAMIEPIIETRACSYVLRIALSRWDNEGGASPVRPDSRASGHVMASTELGHATEMPFQ